MSGPGNNDNLITKAESGSLSLDWNNSEIDVRNESKACDYKFIGLADDSDARKSLLAKITKQLPDEEATEPLTKLLFESNTENESTEINCVKDEFVQTNETTSSHDSNQNDSAISAGSTENSKLLIGNGTDKMKATEEESFKDHYRSITENPAEEAFSAKKSETRSEESPEKRGSTKDIKESSKKCDENDDTNSAINTEHSLNIKFPTVNGTDNLEIKTNDMSLTEREPLMDHLSSITKNPTDQVFSDQSKSRDKDSTENRRSPKEMEISSLNRDENGVTISAISTEVSLNSKLLTENGTASSEIITNDMSITEKESLIYHSSFKPETPAKEEFSADPSDSRTEDTLENRRNSKDMKESRLKLDKNNVAISVINAEFSLNSKVLVENVTDNSEIKTHDLVVTETKSLKDHSSFITGSPTDLAFTEQAKSRAELTPENGGSTKNTMKSSPKRDENDVAISLISKELSLNSELLIENVTSMDNSSSITENSADQAFSDQSKSRAEYTPENTESTKDIKESVSSSKLVNELLENKVCVESGELSQDTTVDVEQDQIQASEESKDLEDGEVSDDDEDGTLKVPVCRFFIRNGCSWGNSCRFRHPGANKKGNYVMFENKVLPVVSTPVHPVWTPSMSPAYPFNLNNVNPDRYYSQDQPEVTKRAPLLPTPSFNDILLAQKNYQKLDDEQRSVPHMDKPKPIVWQSRLSCSSPCSTTFQWSPGRTRSPSVSPPRPANHVQLEVRPTVAATLTCKASVKRYRLPSPARSSATRVRGPRTPPSSPPIRPSAAIQTAPKRQRLYTYVSSSTDSSESSCYTSSTESSEESSSSSDSDKEYRSKRSRQIEQKPLSRAPAKSSSKASTKCTSRHLDRSRRQQTSVIKRTSRHTSKSKSRKHSRTKKKSSKRTPEQDRPTVPSKAPRKPLCEGNPSFPGRREYLLMKLLQVEEQIAKKKKKMNMK